MSNEIQLCVFNAIGLARFKSRLDEISSGKSVGDFSDLTSSPELVIPIRGVTAELPTFFSSRFECGQFFSEFFRGIEGELASSGVDPHTSIGLWAWLSASMSAALLGQRAKPFVGEQARWVYMPNDFGRYYRHLLAGPYSLYDAFRDEPRAVAILLYNEVFKPNTAFVEQIVSRPLLLENREAMKLVHAMYFDYKKNRPKKAPNTTTIVAGDIRRFGVVFNQLALTWDLSGLTMQEISAILPKEFRNLVPSDF